MELVADTGVDVGGVTAVSNGLVARMLARAVHDGRSDAMVGLEIKKNRKAATAISLFWIFIKLLL